MQQRVLGVKASRNSFGPILKLPSCASATTGVCPNNIMGDTLPGSVTGETTTSLPLGSSRAISAKYIAIVPVATASACPPP